MTQTGMYVHRKSGTRYFVLGNCANTHSGERMTAYLADGGRVLNPIFLAICVLLNYVLKKTEGKLYIRREDEFDEPDRFSLQVPFDPDYFSDFSGMAATADSVIKALLERP